MKKKSRFIFLFLKGNLHYFIWALIFSATATISYSLIPQIIRFTVDHVLDGKAALRLPVPEAFLKGTPSRQLTLAALCVIAAALINMASTYFLRLYTAKGAEHFVKRLRDRLFSHIQRLPFMWHTQHQTGDIIQRCTTDVDVVKTFVAQQLLEVFRISFLIIFSLCLMLSINVPVSLVTLLFIPLIVGYSVFYYSRIGQKFLDADEAEGRLSAHVQENLTGVRVVRAFGREKYELDRFNEKNRDFAQLWVRLGDIMSLYWGTGDLITGLQVLVVICIGSSLAVSKAISLGDFLALVSYNAALIWPVRGLGRVLSEMSKAGVSIDRLSYILQSPVEIDPPNALCPPMDRDIVFDHVSFGYDPDHLVLKDLSFTIPAGRTFAITGATGAGKSTLVHLINGLYTLPDRHGVIRIGDTDIRQISRPYLRRHVSVVLQEPFLFSRTIKENIGITLEDEANRKAGTNAETGAEPTAKTEPTTKTETAGKTETAAKTETAVVTDTTTGSDAAAVPEPVRQASRIACIDSAISSFTDGYDTMVGERGVTLSGGQKQRTAIARALVRNADVLILDDSLSAVDTETDIRIRQALRKRSLQSTVILISHRVTTLMQADQILVLSDGQISEIGSHEELLKANGAYRKIYDLQIGNEHTPSEGGEKN